MEIEETKKHRCEHL